MTSRNIVIAGLTLAVGLVVGACGKPSFKSFGGSSTAVVAILEPAPLTIYDGDSDLSQISVSGSCSENGKAVRLQLSSGSTTSFPLAQPICNTDASPNFSASFDLSSLPDETYQLTAQLSDLQNRDSSAAVTVTKAVQAVGSSAIFGNTHEFVHIGPKNYWNVRYASLFGETGWLDMQVRQGERPAGDNPAVDRIGLDGYTDPFDFQRYGTQTVEFSVVPGQNSLAAQSADWWNFFEVHALGEANDSIAPVGPLHFMMEWSSGLSSNVLRIRREIPTYTNTSLSGVSSAILYQSTSVSIDTRLDFRVEFREHPYDGFVRVWMNGVQIVNYSGQFGYGSRRLYPQFRIYRNTRSVVTKAKYKITEVTSAVLPEPSGNLVVNGNFSSNLDGWLGGWSTAPGTPTWQSDGAGGGRLLISSNGSANARLSQEIPTVVGSTYQITFTSPQSLAGFGVGTTRGGFDLLGGLLPGTYQFVATSTTTWVNLISSTNGHTLDNVSVTKVP